MLLFLFAFPFSQLLPISKWFTPFKHTLLSSNLLSLNLSNSLQNATEPLLSLHILQILFLLTISPPVISLLSSSVFICT